MKVTFDYLPEFERRAKTLHKNRMAIASKGKGKSGGARVITYNVKEISQDEVLITLMTIYDKSEMGNVSDAYLKSLVAEIAKH